MRQELFRPVICVLLSVLVLAGCGPKSAADGRSHSTRPSNAGTSPQLPVLRVGDAVRELPNGKSIPRPYDWVFELDDEKLRPWLIDQNEESFKMLHSLPERERVHELVTRSVQLTQRSIVWKSEEYYYFFEHSGMEFHPKLIRTRTPYGEVEVVIDSNTWQDEPAMFPYGTSFSPDSKWLAFGKAEYGSDATVWHIMDLTSLEVLSDRVADVNGEPSWAADSRGFYYGKSGEELDINETAYKVFKGVWFHEVDSHQAIDRLVVKPRANPEQFCRLIEPAGSNWQFLELTGLKVEYNDLFYRPIAKPDADWKSLLGRFEYGTLIGCTGNKVVVNLINNELENLIASIDLGSKGLERDEIANEGSGAFLSFMAHGDYVCWVSRHGFHTAIEYTVRRSRVDRQVGHNVWGLHDATIACIDPDGTTFYLNCSGPGDFPSIYKLVPDGDGLTEIWSSLEVDARSRVSVKSAWFESSDGVTVPIQVFYRRGLTPDQARPTLLTFYGGFGMPTPLAWSPAAHSWLELGGVLAFAAVRGGGDLGAKWHLAGSTTNRQRSVEDVIQASEYLIREGWASRETLCLFGSSHSALLATMAIAQRPELYAAAVLENGPYDLLSLTSYPPGDQWEDEYGSQFIRHEFEAMAAISPLQTIKPGTKLPAMLLMAGEIDDVVSPVHSVRMTAHLQSCQAAANPIRFVLQPGLGHNFQIYRHSGAEITADQIAFLSKHTHRPSR